jgi:PAS domain S-box-containing protein
MKLRILILQDSETDAELIKLVLREANISFISKQVKTREEFIRELHDFTPDLILSDYYLPSFVGLEALAIVKEESPDVPFILVTGALGEEHTVEILKKGAADYVLKDHLSRLPPVILRSLREAQEKKACKLAEEDMRKAARQWRATFDSINNGICLLDHERRILRCNIAMQKIIGKPFSEIIGHKIWTLLECVQEPQKNCPVKQIRKTKGRRISECFLNNRWFSISIDPIIGMPSELSGAVYIMTDITKSLFKKDMMNEIKN